MATIIDCTDDPKGRRLTTSECTEVYNALSDRCNELSAALAAADLPERVRQSLAASLQTCEKLVEVFE